jgi:hypothetical protein
VNIHSRDGSGILCGLPLKAIEICRQGDDDDGVADGCILLLKSKKKKENISR